MNTKLLTLLIAGGLTAWSLSGISYTGGPPDGYTNAPGESNCTSCHGGTALNGGGAFNNITLTTSAALTSLQPNTTYTFNLGFSQLGRSKYGFQLCVLPSGANGSSASIGTLIASSSETQLSSTTSPNRTYLMHDASGTSASGGTKVWQFQYTTPNTISASPVFYVTINASNGNNSGGGDFIYARTFSATVLPVKWGDVSAKRNQNDAVEIHWTTLTEINNDFFEVERSDNGFDWVEAGKVKGGGNQSAKNSYRFVDEAPISAYYRIKQVDYDGKFDYSKIVSIEFEKDVVFTPIYDAQQKSIILPNLDFNEVILTNLKGEQIKPNTTVINGLLSVDVHYLAAGVYVLSTSNNTQQNSWKIWINGN
jgi:hypothetical protein